MAADNWEHIINLMTGFTLAERSAIEGSKGAGGIPWMDVEITSVGMSLHAESTAHGDGMGFDIQFYSGTGTGVGKYQATVTIKDQTDGRQYWKRSAAALADLVASPFKTAGVTSGTDIGGDPTPDSGVDLTTFSTLAKSFDKAGVFFTNHAETLKQWAESLGDENAAWKGQAAGVFWHLINDLHDKYDNYKSELIPPGFSPANTSVSTGYVSTTKHGDSVIGAEVALHTALQSMNDALSKYMNQTGTPVTVTHPDGSTSSDIVSGDTREVLYKVMTEITDWVKTYNAPGVVGYMAPNPYGGYMGNPTAPIQSYTTNATYKDATAWGNLKDTSTWSGAANEAVKRWQTNIETNLDTPARADVTTLQQSWSRVLDPNWDTTFAFEDTDTTSLAQELQQEKADIQQDKANEAQNNLNNSLNGLGDNLNGLGNNLNGLGDNLNNFGDGLNNGLNGFGDSLNNGLNGLGDNLNNFSTGLNNGLNGFGDSISNGLGGLNGLGGPNGLGGDPNGLGGPNGLGPLTGLNGDSSLLPPNGPMPTPGSADFFTNPGPGSTGVRNADGSVTTQNADGSVTTQFPDGSSTTVNPDGTITTHNADGTTTTSQLGPGQTLTNPDGSTTTVSGSGEITTHFPDGSTVTQNADGSLTTTNADGSTSTHFPNGTVETTGADGLTHLTAPDGTTMTQNADGSLTSDFPDGSHTTLNPDGTVTTTTADGHTVTSHLGSGQSLVNPDGSTTTIGSGGAMTTHYPDGSSVTVNPDGTVTTTNATGTSGLGLGDLPPVSHFGTGTGLPGSHLPTTGDSGGLTLHNGDGSSVTHFPSGAHATTDGSGYTTTHFPDGSSSISGPGGQFQTVPSPGTAAASAGAAGGGLLGSVAATPAGAGDAGLSSMMSPMMMMMGMSRMGQQQGGQGQGERVRETYQQNDSDGAFIQGGGYQQQVAPPEEVFEEEEEDPEELPSRTPTTGQGRQSQGVRRPSTQSSSWSEHEEDVWGTGEEGLPASIGR